MGDIEFVTMLAKYGPYWTVAGMLLLALFKISGWLRKGVELFIEYLFSAEIDPRTNEPKGILRPALTFHTQAMKSMQEASAAIKDHSETTATAISQLREVVNVNDRFHRVQFMRLAKLMERIEQMLATIAKAQTDQRTRQACLLICEMLMRIGKKLDIDLSEYHQQVVALMRDDH